MRPFPFEEHLFEDVKVAENADRPGDRLRTFSVGT